MKDIAERIQGRVQITTDGLKAYINAMDAAFPTDEEVDFAQLVKLYGAETGCSTNDRLKREVIIKRLSSKKTKRGSSK